MAAISVNPSAIDHTLPAVFSGIGLANYRHQDFSNATYQAQLAALGFDFLRLNPWVGPPGTVASAPATMTDPRALAIALGLPVVMGNCADPQATPSTKTACDTTNIVASGGGGSPSDWKDWYANYVNNGITVAGMEFYNEPANCAYNNGGGPWFGNGSPTQTDINNCETWAMVEHRAYRGPILTEAATLGVNPPLIHLGVIGDSTGYAQGWNKEWVAGTPIGGVCTWPYGDSNLAYFDADAFHPYPQGSGDQSLMNSIMYNPQPVGNNDPCCAFSFLTNLRSYLNGLGGAGPSKQFFPGEQGVDDTQARGGLFDCAYAVLFCGWQSYFGIRYFSQWSGNVPNTDALSGTRLFNIFNLAGPYAITVRGAVFRDIVNTFVKGRRVIGYGTAGNATPAGTSNNSVANDLWWCCNLDAGGTHLLFLVVNAHGTNTDSLTVTITGGATVSSPATGVYVNAATNTPSWAIGSTGSCPAITNFNVTDATHFSYTFPAFSATLLRVPVSLPAAAVDDDVSRFWWTHAKAARGL